MSDTAPSPDDHLRRVEGQLSLALDGYAGNTVCEVAMRHARARVRVLKDDESLTPTERGKLRVHALIWLSRALDSVTGFGDRGLLEDARDQLYHLDSSQLHADVQRGERA